MDLEGKLKRGGIENIPSHEVNPGFAVEKETPQEISSAEKDNAYGKILSKVQSQASDDVQEEDVSHEASSAMQTMDADSQIQQLVDIAEKKGIVYAVKVAQHMEDNYVLDTFHDKLLGEELHDALVKKGMLKEI